MVVLVWLLHLRISGEHHMPTTTNATVFVAPKIYRMGSIEIVSRGSQLPRASTMLRSCENVCLIKFIFTEEMVPTLAHVPRLLGRHCHRPLRDQDCT